jgi:hypothetical protein
MSRWLPPESQVGAPPPSPERTAGDRLADVIRGPLGVVSFVAAPALAYHGYRRNTSIGWAIGWFFVPWPIGLPIAIAQGFGRRA